jgi:type II secretory pathway pseudopilin PulG
MKKNTGLTIIEALIAIVILGIALATIIPSLTAYTKVNTDSEKKGETVAVVQHVMDNLRQKQFTDWPTNGSSYDIASGGRTYKAKISWCAKGPTNCYTSDSARHVKVEVIYNEKTIYTVETVYTTFN